MSEGHTYGHMANIKDLKARIRELELDLERQDEQIKELRQERGEAYDLVDDMRDRIEDSNALIDSWIEVFQMQQDENGIWIFDRKQSDLWNNHQELQERHRKLVRDWNRFIRNYNATVAPRQVGRPIEASDAQVKEVRKLRKSKSSLRAIAERTNLGLRTVRTIVEQDQGTDRKSKQANLLRKREFDRMKAADYRARKKARGQLPARIDQTLKRGKELVKAAKGLGE